MPALENLLNILNTVRMIQKQQPISFIEQQLTNENAFTFQNSAIEKSFLFDVVSKIYIATDSTPVDMQSYELCCDMIDVVIDVSCIYG